MPPDNLRFRTIVLRKKLPRWYDGSAMSQYGRIGMRHFPRETLATVQPSGFVGMTPSFVIANGQQLPAELPCSLEQFLLQQRLLPRSVVVEHNGEAVAPSEFSKRQLASGDRLEIVKIVAGG